jgi:FlgD Ig-like domain
MSKAAVFSFMCCLFAQLLASPAKAYNSEEHKLLVDMGASMVHIDPSIVLPPTVGMRTATIAARKKVYTDAKYLAVGFRSNNVAQYDSTRHEVQDNSYWYGWDQRVGNLDIHIPTDSELRETTLEASAWTSSAVGTPPSFTIGELASIYGDYRRSTYCVRGDCYLTDSDTPTLGFADGTDCFGPFDCGWQPASVSMATYLRYIASGVWPPYDAINCPTTGYANYGEAAWWGDEMFRIAASNDWHFSSAAVAWYVGCHRLALYYASQARSTPAYWNQAIHYEANGLHSLTDLFAFGHVVTNRDRTSHGIADNAGVLGTKTYVWAENVLSMGGGTRNSEGRVHLGIILPEQIADRPRERLDLLKTVAGTWTTYGIQEHDFHDCYNGSGATVRNLRGDQFVIYGDSDLPKTPEKTREIIADAVRASLQSLFDGYVDLGRGKSLRDVAAPGSPFFAALRNLPIFVEKNPQHEFDGYFSPEGPTGNNYNGRWTIYAQSVDVLAGTNVVPDGPLDCVMRYEDGERTIEPLVPDNPCSTFPAVVPPPPPGLPSTVLLEQSFPNPFATSTTIRFALPRRADVTLEVFDLQGGKVRTLVNENRGEGRHFVIWDGTSDEGKTLPAGLYFYRLSVEGATYSRRVALVL